MASGLDVLVGSYRRSMRFPSLIERPLMIQRVVPTRGVSRKLPRLLSLRVCYRRRVLCGAANAELRTPGLGRAESPTTTSGAPDGYAATTTADPEGSAGCSTNSPG